MSKGEASLALFGSLPKVCMNRAIQSKSFQVCFGVVAKLSRMMVSLESRLWRVAFFVRLVSSFIPGGVKLLDVVNFCRVVVAATER